MTYRTISRARTRSAAAALGALTIAFAAAAGAAGSDGSGGIGSGGGIDSGGGSYGEGSAGGGFETVTTSGAGEFPIRGRHTYGDGLGAGRDHQGQDILAKCGKPVVAAQPGRVQLVDSHGSAGNYVVLDGAGKLNDTVYMHLMKRSKVSKRERVSAGDLIGRVGSTGNASTCHLHFEIWSAPGYYEGGSPLDPKPYLRRWDRPR